MKFECSEKAKTLFRQSQIKPLSAGLGEDEIWVFRKSQNSIPTVPN